MTASTDRPAPRWARLIYFSAALAAYAITGAGAAVLFRHDIIVSSRGFYDHDRWTGRVIACDLVIPPKIYLIELEEKTHGHPPKGPPAGWTEDEWKDFTSRPGAAVPPGKSLPTAEFFGPRPLSLDEAIDKLGDYISCAPRPVATHH